MFTPRTPIKKKYQIFKYQEDALIKPNKLWNAELEYIVQVHSVQYLGQGARMTQVDMKRGKGETETKGKTQNLYL